MRAIEPNQFYPREPGVQTQVTLPGRSKFQRIKVLRIRDGMAISHSHFSAACAHRDHIKRPKSQVLIVLNISGEMTLGRMGTKERYLLSNGEAWVVRLDGTTLVRCVEEGRGCSNLILALDVPKLPAHIANEFQAKTAQEQWIRKLELPLPGRSELNTMFTDLESPAALTRIEGKCLILLGHAIEELAKPAHTSSVSGADLLVSRARAILCEQLAEHCSLRDIARNLAVSQATLNKAFKTVLGRTVFEELRLIRIERADSLVRNSDLSLGQISYECGFSSPAHMSTAFRKHFGTPPKARRNLQARTANERNCP